MLYGVMFAEVEVVAVDEAAEVYEHSWSDSFSAEQRGELKQDLQLLGYVRRSRTLVKRAERGGLRLVGLSSLRVSELTVAVPERPH